MPTSVAIETLKLIEKPANQKMGACLLYNLSMIKLLLLAFSFSALASSDPLFISVYYYDGLGTKFRVETAQKWPKCEASKLAQKVFIDDPNELRELRYWDEKGVVHEAGAFNNFEVHEVVNNIFAGTQRESENPCLKQEKVDSKGGASATAVEYQSGRQALRFIMQGFSDVGSKGGV